MKSNSVISRRAIFQPRAAKRAWQSVSRPHCDRKQLSATTRGSISAARDKMFQPRGNRLQLRAIMCQSYALRNRATVFQLHTADKQIAQRQDFSLRATEWNELAHAQTYFSLREKLSND
jgi:hypothetical protein